MIRMIASDLDGTLLEPVERLPEGLYETLEQLEKLGITFVAASGRQYDNLRRLFAPAAREMGFICENGALNVLRSEEIKLQGIERDMAIAIVRRLMQMPVQILVSGRHTCYVSPGDKAFTDDMVYRLRNTIAVVDRLDELDDEYLKVSAYSPAGIAGFAKELQEEWGSRLNAVVSGQCWFDFGTASKETGIRALMDAMHLKREEVAAFGDQFNDVSMLDAVGHPFIMSSASGELKKRGYHVCDKVLPVLKRIVECRGEISLDTYC